MKRLCLAIVLSLTGCTGCGASPRPGPPPPAPTSQRLLDHANAAAAPPAAEAGPLGGVKALAPGVYRITVRLAPHPSVTGATRVSFGLPLPPGVVTDSGRVRLLDEAGEEIAAHVSSLGSWHGLPPTKLLCAGLPAPTQPGIRSLLVQADVDPKALPRITVELGAIRSKNISEATPVRDTWQPALRGSYGPDDGIMEPRVYALLPPAWLVCSNLTTLETVSSRDPIMRASDAGQIDFFETTINSPRANPRGIVEDERIDYREHYEPWLYDRAQTFYNGYIRTGRLEFLREAHRAVQHYMAELYDEESCDGKRGCNGFFRLKNPDPAKPYKDSKYSYNESLATLYWLSGDPEPKKHLGEVSEAARSLNLAHVVDEMGTFFTERHWAFALSALIFEYEVTGEAKLSSEIQVAVDALYQNQSKPFPKGSNNPVNGCWNHDWERTGKIGFSPWKMSLLAHALLRAHHSTGAERVPTMLREAARCIQERALYRPEQPPYLMPREEALSLGAPRSTDGNPWSDVEHAIDVAYLLALGAFFSNDSAKQAKLTKSVKQLLLTHEYVLDKWTRESGWPDNQRAKHRVTPPRKYAWWYKNAGAISWALGNPSRLPTPGG